MKTEKGGLEEKIQPMELKKIPPELAVFCWQNFLKRLANDFSEKEARELLIKELDENSSMEAGKNIRTMLIRDNFSLPVTDEEIDNNLEELSSYINGRLNPRHSKTFESIAGKQEEKEPAKVLSDGEKQKAYQALAKAYDEKAKVVDDGMVELIKRHGNTKQIKNMVKKRSAILENRTGLLKNEQKWSLDDRIAFLQKLVNDLCELERGLSLDDKEKR